MTAEPLGQMKNTERELGPVQDEQDPLTVDRLRTFGLGPGSRCLDLGAGQGSVARWLADLVGPGGVTAVDRNALPLRDLEAEGVTVVEADVAVWDAGDAGYDLVHARALLTHLPDREQVLSRMVSWLAPGGWLLVSDPADFPVASSPYPAMRRAATVLTDLAITMGTDPSWARRYPAQLAAAGLVDVDAECRLRMMRGGTREALMLHRLYDRARPAMLAAGMTEAELDEIQGLLLNEGYLDLPPAVVRAWGRRPSRN
jgi:2-polyprenyl-3-methyl-5-hydroxy-6-metoxy-1,4-benzoquinol methylase